MLRFTRGLLVALLLCAPFLVPVPAAQADPVAPSQDINTYVLFAYTSLNFKGRNADPTGGTITGGNVGVNSLATSNFTPLIFGGPTYMPTDGTYVAADKVGIDDADLWAVFANAVNSNYGPTIRNATPPSPIAFTLADATHALIAPGDLPTLPSFTASTLAADDRTVTNGSSLILDPGTYRDVRVNDDGHLYLGDGTYVLRTLSSGKDVTIHTSDNTIVLIERSMLFNNDCLVTGSDGAQFILASLTLGANDSTVAFSRRTEFHGQVFAPNGRINLSNDTDLYGRFWADEFGSDFNARVTYSFPPPPPTNLPEPATFGLMAGGGLLLLAAKRRVASARKG